MVTSLNRTDCRVLEVDSLAALQATNALWPAIDLSLELPDAHYVSLAADGTALARCSVWWNSVGRIPGERVGYVGHYAASDIGAGLAVLSHATRALAARGCTLAVGPINGNTWRSYRFVTGGSDTPAFFLEPNNQGEWPEYFRRCGFSVLQTYHSNLVTDLSKSDPECEAIRADITSAGITLRSFDNARAEHDLNSIFDLSSLAFAHNFLYSAISRVEFLGRYRPLIELFNPELVIMAEKGTELVGFVMSLPDLKGSASPEQSASKTLIVKTVARSPSLDVRGLGRLLFDETHRRALEHGYTRAIHALVKDGSVCGKISSQFGNLLRTYALFAKRLQYE